MGAFFNSICVPGDHRETTRRVLERWLAAKGFEPCPGPVLFDLDGDHERSAFLVSSERWTVVFYSHYEEERRLIRELQAEVAPIFYVWVYDSDVWGWDLFDGEGFVASFNPDPRTHQSFADAALGSAGRPRGDAGALCRALGLGDDEARALRRLERQRSPFREEVCRRFCRALGVEVAASSYDDLETGALGQAEGWVGEQLLFGRRGPAPVPHDVDLHRQGLRRLQPEMGYAPSETVELPPEILAEMKRMRRRVRLAHRLLRPVSWLARTWRALRQASRRRPESSEPEPRPVEPPGTFRIESAVLINDRHRCRITLAEGVRPTVVSRKPASVFAFAVGWVTVTCTARRLSKIDEVLRKPSRARVLHDEPYRVGGLKARRLLFELPPSFVAGSQEPTYLAITVIQTELALYVFLHRSRKPLAEREQRAVRATIDSFRLLPPAREDDGDG